MCIFIVLIALAAPPQSPTGQFDKFDLDNLPPVPPATKAEAPKRAKSLPLPPSTTYQNGRNQSHQSVDQRTIAKQGQIEPNDGQDRK